MASTDVPPWPPSPGKRGTNCIFEDVEEQPTLKRSNSDRNEDSSSERKGCDRPVTQEERDIDIKRIEELRRVWKELEDSYGEDYYFDPFYESWVNPTVLTKQHIAINQMIEQNYKRMKEDYLAQGKLMKFAIFGSDHDVPYNRIEPVLAPFRYVDVDLSDHTMERDMQIMILYHRCLDKKVPLKRDDLRWYFTFNSDNIQILQEYMDKVDMSFDKVTYHDQDAILGTLYIHDVNRNLHKEAVEMVTYLSDGSCKEDYKTCHRYEFEHLLDTKFPYIYFRNLYTSKLILRSIEDETELNSKTAKKWVAENATPLIDEDWKEDSVGLIEYLEEKLRGAFYVGLIRRIPWEPEEPEEVSPYALPS